jgi:hypothetical protein
MNPLPIQGLFIDDLYYNVYKRPREPESPPKDKKKKKTIKFGLRKSTKRTTRKRTTKRTTRKRTTKRTTRKRTTKRTTRKRTTKRKTTRKRTTKRKTTRKRTLKPKTIRKPRSVSVYDVPRSVYTITPAYSRPRSNWKVSFEFKFIRTWEDGIPKPLFPNPTPSPTKEQLNNYMRTRYKDFLESLFVYDEYGKMPSNVSLDSNNVVSFQLEKGEVFPTAESVIKFLKYTSLADGVWEGMPGSAGVYPDPKGDELGVIGIKDPTVHGNGFGKKKPKRWIQKVTKTFEKKGTKGAFTRWCRSKGFSSVSLSCIKLGKKSKSLRTRRRAIFAENIRRK